MKTPVVIMGVAGCGKSSLGAAVAQAEDAVLVEGDEFHSEASRDKMSRGIALTDADREDWLARLGEQLRAGPRRVVLTCSALKRAYRDRLRTAAPGVRFVFLDISPEQARARVAERVGSHFFSPTLVDSQFAALEPPVGEPDVLRVDALAPLSRLRAEVSAWLHEQEGPMKVEPGTGWHRAVNTAMAICLGVMAIAVFVNVVLRYGFGSGIAASEELSRLLFVWMVFIGAAAAYPVGEHMAFTGLIGMLRERPRALAFMTVVIRVLVVLACVLLAWGAWQQVEVGMGSRSVVLGYPTALLPLPAFLCAVAIGVMALVELVRHRPLDLGAPAEVE